MVSVLVGTTLILMQLRRKMLDVYYGMRMNASVQYYLAMKSTEATVMITGMALPLQGIIQVRRRRVGEEELDSSRSLFMPRYWRHRMNGITLKSPSQCIVNGWRVMRNGNNSSSSSSSSSTTRETIPPPRKTLRYCPITLTQLQRQQPMLRPFLAAAMALLGTTLREWHTVMMPRTESRCHHQDIFIRALMMD